MAVQQYPFDPEGKLTSNIVRDEQHVLTAANGRDFRCVVPKLGPFFAKDLIIKIKSGTAPLVTLTLNQDYYLTHKFLDASRMTGQEIFGSITMLRDDLVGTLVFTQRRILGGDWILSDVQWQEVVANVKNNPRIITWEQVAKVPLQFPVIDHQFNIIDLIGMKETVEALRAIEEAISGMSEGSILMHLQDYNNPHRTTKTHVGLGLVQNYGVASTADMEAGTGNKYVTPGVLKPYVDKIMNTSVKAWNDALMDAIASNRTYTENTRTELLSLIANHKSVLDAAIATSKAEAIAAAKAYTDQKMNEVKALI